MKRCNKCGTEVHKRESDVFFVLILIAILTSWYFTLINILAFISIGVLLCAWIYNSQRSELKNKDFAKGQQEVKENV